MPSYGGTCPYPRRMGGGPSLVAVIMDSFAASRGTAYSTSQDSAVMVENLAFAREIAAAYEANKRLANQFDPSRMTESLDDWTKMMKIVVRAGMTDAQKRDAVAAVFSRVGNDILRTYVEPLLQAALGGVYYDIEYIPYASAVMSVPDGTYPWGVVTPNAPWSSTVCRVLVRLQKLTGMSEGEFYEEAGKVFQVLDNLLPAWVTFDWYREPATGTPIVVAGGPSAAGFYLDDDHNLDNSLFD